jgi:pimeloyl-ACP methyl ester carboxylesterase
MKKFLFSILLSGVITASQAMPIKQASYTDQGKGEPLVLIHAFPTDHHLWEPQIKPLAQQFRVITLDLKGFGNATATHGEAVSMREYADEVKQLLDQLKIDKAIIGGESMGGYVSLAFVKAYPEKTAGLILADTQTIADTEDQKAKRELAALDVLKNGTGKFVENFVSKAVSSNADQSIKDFLTELSSRQSVDAVASALRGMSRRENTMDQLSSLTIPVLIISGDLDTIISTSESQAMHNALPASKLVIIHGAGHLTNIERPEEWNAAVIAAFAK